MAKKAITIISCEETFKNLSSFSNLKEMNETVRYYKEKYAHQLTKSTRSVLAHLQKYSAKYLGVSFLAKATIAEALQISRRTVIRACQALESLGIIKQLEMKRASDMQQTSNAIIILPIEDGNNDNVPQGEVNNGEECHTKSNSSLKTKFIKDIRTGNVNQQQELDSIIPDWINNVFGRYALQFYNVKQVKELYRIALIHSKAYSFNSKGVQDIALDAFKQLVVKVKNGKIENPFGYFNGIIKKKMKKSHLVTLFNEVWAS